MGIRSNLSFDQIKVGLPTGNADAGPPSRFLKQMGDKRWELASIMKIGESFGGEDKMLYCWKRPTLPRNLSFCLRSVSRPWRALNRELLEGVCDPDQLPCFGPA